MKLEKKLQNLPTEPGVYLMKDMEGKIIYIGKAVNLRNRVRSYFRNCSDGRYFATLLSNSIHDIETIITRNEAEAVLLESTLIRKHRPCFNIEIKSEGYFLYVRIDTKSDFPRFELVRKRRDDRALYFGPYHSAKAIREISHLLGNLFGMRTCSDSFLKNRKNPCIEYQMGRCLAPCARLVSRNEYSKAVNNVVTFFSGRKKELILKLKNKMSMAAKDLHFEYAAKLRDLLKKVESTLLVNKNAQNVVKEHMEMIEKNNIILGLAKKELQLKRIPQRIECYDISNIQGTDAYGSMVVFLNGMPSKKDYRCFKIKLKHTPDDFMMMAEILTRRFKKIATNSLPDLVVIDGGFAHLKVAHRVLQNFNLDLDLLAIAKERNQVSDRLYLINKKRIIPENRDVLHLLMRARDEAHRFAIKLHRKGREKKNFISALDQIPSVGKVRKKALLLHFGSLKNVMGATVEQISSVKGINKQLAMKIYKYFHGE